MKKWKTYHREYNIRCCTRVKISETKAKNWAGKSALFCVPHRNILTLYCGSWTHKQHVLVSICWQTTNIRGSWGYRSFRHASRNVHTENQRHLLSCCTDFAVSIFSVFIYQVSTEIFIDVFYDDFFYMDFLDKINSDSKLTSEVSTR